MQTTRMETASMGKNGHLNASFIACVPQQIEADWDEKWGPLLAGFPLNIVYTFVPRESKHSEILAIIISRYEPDLATFRNSKKTRTMTYCNSEGGTYRVR